MKLFKKKKKANLILTFKSFISLFTFLFLIGGVIFIFTNDYFKITNIVCEKDKLPCSEKAKDLFFDLIKENIFLLDSDKIIKSVKKNNFKIKQIIIQKKLPNKVLIQITEREEFICFTFDEKSWFIVDDSGFVFRKVYEQPKNPVLVYLKNGDLNLKIGQKLEEKEAGIISSVLKLLDDNFIFLSKISVDFNKGITLFLKNGVVASLSAKKKVSSQVDSLHFILRQSKIEGSLPLWIDLRFDKPVVKF